MTYEYWSAQPMKTSKHIRMMTDEKSELNTSCLKCRKFIDI